MILLTTAAVGGMPRNGIQFSPADTTTGGPARSPMVISNNSNLACLP